MSPFKRLFDLACVVPALFLLSPGILMIAALVRLTSKGPAFFQQARAGHNRHTFTIYKFRTMRDGAAASGPGVTQSGDPRLTPLGSFLRKHKLDEIPQFYNVLRGDMSLVGPRPKLPHFEQLEMICRPGITGAATLVFANEEELLKDVPPEDLDRFHIEELSPIKKLLDQQYQKSATFSSDLELLIGTIWKRSKGLSMEKYMPLAGKDLSFADSSAILEGRAH